MGETKGGGIDECKNGGRIGKKTLRNKEWKNVRKEEMNKEGKTERKSSILS
jgi:hypothetical protein